VGIYGTAFPPSKPELAKSVMSGRYTSVNKLFNAGYTGRLPPELMGTLSKNPLSKTRINRRSKSEMAMLDESRKKPSKGLLDVRYWTTAKHFEQGSFWADKEIEKMAMNATAPRRELSRNHFELPPGYS